MSIRQHLMLWFMLSMEKQGVTIAGKSFVLKEGEMIVMPGNKTHALRATQRFKMLLVMIRT